MWVVFRRLVFGSPAARVRRRPCLRSCARFALARITVSTDQLKSDKVQQAIQKAIKGVKMFSEVLF